MDTLSGQPIMLQSLPTDVLRLIWKRLDITRQSYLRRTCKYFYTLNALLKDWVDEGFHYLIEVGFDPYYIARLLQLQSLLSPGTEMEVSQRELNYVCSRIETSAIPRNLLRCIYEAIQRQKEYDNRMIVSHFYAANRDKKHESTLNTLIGASVLGTESMTDDAVNYLCRKFSARFIYMAIRTDDVRIFSHCIQHLPPDKMVSDFGMFNHIINDRATRILTWLRNNDVPKAKYYYHVDLFQLNRFIEFFDSPMNVMDVIIIKHKEIKSSMVDWFKETGYTIWSSHNVVPQTLIYVISLNPKNNPWI